MSRSASRLGSITTRDTVDTRPGTLEFRAGALAADGARRRLIPFWMTSDRRADLYAPRARRSPRLRGSQDSHNRPFNQREALTP
jgi:hypothetical protein